jgi:trehalose 6-phosphate synthase
MPPTKKEEGLNADATSVSELPPMEVGSEPPPLVANGFASQGGHQEDHSGELQTLFPGVVAANRGPVTLKLIRDPETGEKRISFGQAPGGLANMYAALKGSDTTIVCWAGIDLEKAGVSEADQLEIERQIEEEYGYKIRFVRLTDEDTKLSYNGFSNDIAWMVNHGLEIKKEGGLAEIEKCWKAYVETNQKFSGVIAEVLASKPLEKQMVWIHDYHLYLVSQMLQEQSPVAASSFFLHSPFPGLESLARMPHLNEFMDALVMMPIIGVQSEEDKVRLEAALDSFSVTDRPLIIVAGIGTEMSAAEIKDQAIYDGTRAKVLKFREAAPDDENQEPYPCIMSVQRGDITKGILLQLQTVRRLLNEGVRVKLILVAQPTRQDNPRYIQAAKETATLVAQINKDFPGSILTFPKGVDTDERLAIFHSCKVAGAFSYADGFCMTPTEACLAFYGKGVESASLLISKNMGIASRLLHSENGEGKFAGSMVALQVVEDIEYALGGLYEQACLGGKENLSPEERNLIANVEELYRGLTVALERTPEECASIVNDAYHVLKQFDMPWWFEINLDPLNQLMQEKLEKSVVVRELELNGGFQPPQGVRMTSGKILARLHGDRSPGDSPDAKKPRTGGGLAIDLGVVRRELSYAEEELGSAKSDKSTSRDELGDRFQEVRVDEEEGESRAGSAASSSGTPGILIDGPNGTPSFYCKAKARPRTAGPQVRSTPPPRSYPGGGGASTPGEN